MKFVVTASAIGVCLLLAFVAIGVITILVYAPITILIVRYAVLSHVKSVPIVIATIVMANAKTQALAVEAEVQLRLILLLPLIQLLEIQ